MGAAKHQRAPFAISRWVGAGHQHVQALPPAVPALLGTVWALYAPSLIQEPDNLSFSALSPIFSCQTVSFS